MSAPLLDHRRGWWRAVTRAAFTPYAPRPRLAYRHARSWSEQPPVLPASRRDARDRLVVIVPTVTVGTVAPRLRAGLERVAEAVAVLLRAEPALDCLVAVVVHDATAPGAAPEAAERIERDWLASGTAVALVVLTVSEPSKVLALNSTVGLLDRNGASAVAWFDDDVEVAPDCLLALWRAYHPSRTRVYGALARSPASNGGAGPVGAALGSMGAATNPYPYGCSMLMSRDTFGAGIPLIYMSDDHYYALALLDPAAGDPLHRLRVVPDAVVRIGPAPTLRLAVRRVVRNYRNVQRVLADTDPAAVRWFRRRVHFAGLRPPRDRREALAPGYWARQAFQLARLLLWYLVVAEVLARGLLGRPRPAYWCADHGR